ncbi:MAG: branched-chain amino acid aminotransferase [Bacteroidota bacterium]|nr:branched-chain amino acid aminotransferase [Bacteroidota bacterium]
MSELTNLDWGKLPFTYSKTDYNVRCYYRDGKWGELEVSSSEYFSIHMSAIALHYGQESFEGLKAFRGKDGKIRLFRWEENAKRMQSSSRGIMMPEFSTEKFKEAIFKAVKLNERFVPPYGSGASLYIRPVLFGITPGIGVKPSEDYLFVVFVMPVGPYFKAGFKPVDMLLVDQYDRAAPLGTGNIKVGGNYAAGMKVTEMAHDRGFANVIFLDAKEKKYIDECGPANFFGIKGNTYVTPESLSILPSITNKSLIKIAESLGFKAERRKVPIEELAEFDEVGACGTAAVISPIGRIVENASNKEHIYSKDGKPGKVSTKLYETLLGIQNGDLPDEFGWVSIVE